MRMLSALALAALAFTGTTVDAKANTHIFHRLFKTMADGDVSTAGCIECTLNDAVCASPITIQIPTGADATCDDLTSGIAQISAFAADEACAGKINGFFCDLAGAATTCGGVEGQGAVPEWFDQRCGEVVSCLNPVGQVVASQSDICGLVRNQFGGVVVAPTGAIVEESSTGDAVPVEESSTGDVIIVPVDESSTGDVIVVPVDESSTGEEEPTDNQSTGIIETSTGVIVIPPSVTGGLDGTGVTAVPIDGVSTGSNGGVVVNPPNNGGNNGGNTNAATSSAGVSWMIMGLVLSLGVLLA